MNKPGPTCPQLGQQVGPESTDWQSMCVNVPPIMVMVMVLVLVTTSPTS